MSRESIRHTEERERATPEALMREVLACMASKSLRRTESRLRLLTLLCSSDRPLTLHEIQLATPGLATSSLYRNVIALEGAGVLRRVTGSDGQPHFELADQIDGHHHHLICSVCGVVTDVELGHDLEIAVHRAAVDVHERVGFRVSDHTIDMYGVCRSCSEHA